MIDINQLSALVSAFRVETEKESILPDNVGSLLQNITDLLASASSSTEHFGRTTAPGVRHLGATQATSGEQRNANGVSGSAPNITPQS